jgi:hypothetical protein
MLSVDGDLVAPDGVEWRVGLSSPPARNLVDRVYGDGGKPEMEISTTPAGSVTMPGR